ncbi:tricetin 3',4',5'-O-trimethyltransferase-like [Dioscorea cayenensis subsp. rotundata]|uniref:Tricetin 3',4',5'-O-trimethyltransferase-like n=1 Tax=Dioscorea cayennensis subsp. rotundata TaxID=55577 RepID=A0AB40ASU6_DIOCR|nr:tricetin 3',4',5'-O-trimethyltransferase-like [Dioscorea cayenensis subsp. rotundata]
MTCVSQLVSLEKLKFLQSHGMHIKLESSSPKAVKAGVEHAGGDMFESVPSGDAILMKWILHDWSDEHGLKILKNCWKALPANGKMILVEYMLPMAPESTHASQTVLQLDMIMLANNPGGKERSAQEFESMAKQAGFSAMKPHFSFVGVWLIELYK